MAICDRLEVLVEGRDESKSPWVAECFLTWWLLSSGDEEPVCVTERPAFPGREKL
jgi:hypothetical protein